MSVVIAAIFYSIPDQSSLEREGGGRQYLRRQVPGEPFAEMLRERGARPVLPEVKSENERHDRDWKQMNKKLREGRSRGALVLKEKRLGEKCDIELNN